MEYNFLNQTNYYKGKVRDVYTINDTFLVMIASNRISAFDVILPKEIPFKGQVLNQLAFDFLEATKTIVPNWAMQSPFPNITIGKKCNPYKIEVVVRAYLAGHAWREYKSGKRELCGISLPDGLRENEKLPFPIITPSTKADFGHDMDISKEEIISKKIVSEKNLNEIYSKALQLFEYGTQHALKRGLILVDTKYEFGSIDDKLILMDEIHTPDSSRYFIEKNYLYNLENNLNQEQLSKEFVRQWLIENNFQGKEGQQIPTMNEEWVNTISEKYIELFEKISGKQFQKSPQIFSKIEIENQINNILQNLT